MAQRWWILAFVSLCTCSANDPDSATADESPDSAADPASVETGWWMGESLAFFVAETPTGPQVRELHLLDLRCDNAEFVASDGQSPCAAELAGAVFVQPSVNPALGAFDWTDGQGIHWTGAFESPTQAQGDLEVFDTMGRCCLAERTWTASPATAMQLENSPLFASCDDALNVESIQLVASDLGGNEFEVVDGASIPVVPGAQGALMVRLRAEGSNGLTAAGLSARVSIRVDDGEVGSTVQALANPFSSAGSPTNGAGARTASKWSDILAVLYYDTGAALNPVVPGDISAIDDQTATVEASVFSPCGLFAESNASITLRYD